MTHRAQEIPSLVGGVSQQPEALRLASQAAGIDDAWLSSVDGLTQRQPTKHIGRVLGGPTQGGTNGPVHGHAIDRDKFERYILALRNRELAVSDLHGVEYPVKGSTRQHLKRPTNPSTGTLEWNSLGAHGVSVIQGLPDPAGGNNAIRITALGADPANATWQNATISANRLETGKAYVFSSWVKPQSGFGQSKISIDNNAFGIADTEMVVQWTNSTPFVESLVELDTNAQSIIVHEHGLIPRHDGWFIWYVVVQLDKNASTGLACYLHPDLGAFSRYMDVFEIMLEEWDPILGKPSERWSDWDPDLSDPFAPDLSYFEARTPNLLSDPEDFKDTGSGGAWALTTAVAPGASTVQAPVSGLGFGRSTFTQLKCALAAGGAGVYSQTIGTIFDGPQLFSTMLSHRGQNAIGCTLAVEDKTAATESSVSVRWRSTSTNKLLSSDLTAEYWRVFATGTRSTISTQDENGRTITAYELDDNDAASFYAVFNDRAFDLGVDYTLSFKFKKSTSTKLFARIGALETVTIATDTGLVLNGGGSTSVTSLANGVFLVELHAIGDGSSHRMEFQPDRDGTQEKTIFWDVALNEANAALSFEAPKPEPFIEDAGSSTVQDFGVSQSPFDPLDYMVWVSVDPNAPNSPLVAGGTRACRVDVISASTGVTVFANAWGALLQERAKEPAEGFLTYMEPLLRFRSMTVNDFTFLSNPSIDVNRGWARNDSDPTKNIAYVFVRQGGYARDYRITVKSAGATAVAAAGTEPNVGVTTARCAFGRGLALDNKVNCEAGGGNWIEVGGNDNMVENQSSATIAFHLSQLLTASAAWITASSTGSVIEIVTTAGNEIDSIQVEDSVGDDALILIWRTIEDSADLPANMRDGWRLKVSGRDSDLDPWWVRFRATKEGDLGSGAWEESTGWDDEIRIDLATAPRQLVRRIDNAAGDITGTANQIYFELDTIHFKDRRVGDDETNPFPAFVGSSGVSRGVSDFLFQEGRLGILSDESISLSRVNQFFSFFRSSIQNLDDSDAILATASFTEVSKLTQGIGMDDKLLLFSERQTFLASGNPILSPKTISILPKLSAEVFRRVKAVRSKRGVFVAFPQRGLSSDVFRFSGVYEILPGNDPELILDNITNAVPAYIEGEILQMASNVKVGLLVVLTDRAKIYAFRFQDDGQRVTQQAWSRWMNTSDPVLFIGFIQTDLVALVRRPDGITVERLAVGEDVFDPGKDYSVLLDRRVERNVTTVSYDAVNDETTITLPYSISDGAAVHVIEEATGNDLPVLFQSASSVIVRGDLTGALNRFFAGQEIEMVYEFTKPILTRQRRDGSLVPETRNVSVVAAGRLSFDDSHRFQVDVEIEGGESFSSEYAAPILGAPGSPLASKAPFGSGVLDFEIGAEQESVKITLRSKSHLPCRILSGQWTFNTTRRFG